MKFLLIADDLTGTLDSGVCFAGRANTKVYVSPNVPASIMTDPETEVLCINADCRHKTPAEAYYIVSALVAAGRNAGFDFFFIKTDSALRGNIGAELAAVCGTLSVSEIPFAPAHPVMGRIVKDGILSINGTPVAESSFGKDPFNPVTSSVVTDILSANIAQLSAPEAAASAIRVYNSENLEQLSLIGEAILESEIPAAAGCGGLASVLAAQLYPEIKKTPVPKASSMVLVCGSLHEKSRAQVDYASRVGTAVSILAAKAPAKPPTEVQRREAAKAFAETTARFMNAVHPDVLCIFGGDTAAAIMEKLGVTTLQIEQEIYPGIVASSFHYAFRKVTLITKAGSFGGETLIKDLEKIYLR